jgi:hypothetical protein
MKSGAQKGCTPWNKGKKTGPSPYWYNKRPDPVLFVANNNVARHIIKRRILDRCLIEYVCSECGIGTLWNGKEMPLILDHINGINNDDRLENLRFVCSNCDSQLSTYKARNKHGAANLLVRKTVLKTDSL